MSLRWAHILLRGVGIVAVLLAAGGVLYTATSLYTVASGGIDELAVEAGTLYVHSAFYAMATICLFFYAVVLICGVQFIRLRSSLWWLFSVVLVAEVAFHFLVGWLGSHPTLGESIAWRIGYLERWSRPAVRCAISLVGPDRCLVRTSNSDYLCPLTARPTRSL